MHGLHATMYIGISLRTYTNQQRKEVSEANPTRSKGLFQNCLSLRLQCAVAVLLLCVYKHIWVYVCIYPCISLVNTHLHMFIHADIRPHKLDNAVELFGEELYTTYILRAHL